MLTVVKNEDIDEEKLQAEYVLIQDVDYYNPVYIEALLERCDFHPEEMFGYQGVVTQTDMLIKHNNGTRFYQKHHNDGVMVTDERMSYLESLISKKQINVWEEDKFEASRKIYAAWNKSNARCKVEEEKKLQIIMNIFKGIKDGTTLAIRGGGIHTLRMLMVLPYELRQKVSYIIDCDKNCVAGKLGVCVISPDELEDYAIDTIILSSFDFRGAWKESLKSFSGALMDVYDAFEEQGIYCTRDFYRRTFCPEDFIEEG